MMNNQLPIDLRPYESVNVKALPAMEMPATLITNIEIPSITKKRDTRGYQSASIGESAQKPHTQYKRHATDDEKNGKHSARRHADIEMGIKIDNHLLQQQQNIVNVDVN